jgi:hypothetical protein
MPPFGLVRFLEAVGVSSVQPVLISPAALLDTIEEGHHLGARLPRPADNPGQVLGRQHGAPGAAPRRCWPPSRAGRRRSRGACHGRAVAPRRRDRTARDGGCSRRTTRTVFEAERASLRDTAALARDTGHGVQARHIGAGACRQPPQ